MIDPSHQDCFNRSLCRIQLGKSYLWISLRVFPCPAHSICILVVVDLLTKYGHFIPLRHPFTASSVAKSFFHTVYRLHGLPGSIITDRDRIFISHFWSELFKLADVKLCRSMPYHPQSDGQTEGLNQCLETYLRCYVHACPHQWSQWLSSAQFWYNTYTCPHSAIGRTHFEALWLPSKAPGYRSLGCF